MAKVCEKCGKKPQSGNNVSHANNKSKRRFVPNLKQVRAVKASGELLAVRVTEHRETPGLGDYIDPKKDKNKAKPWITQFNGQSHELAEDGRWKVTKDGGQFVYHTGATISARAVTNATGRALAWAAERHEKLFAQPVATKFEEKQP